MFRSSDKSGYSYVEKLSHILVFEALLVTAYWLVQSIKPNQLGIYLNSLSIWFVFVIASFDA